MNRWVGLALCLVGLGALALRAPGLALSPMHNDEAVNALKLRGLWEKGTYRYDPIEYHGPVLYYASLPVVWLSGARNFSEVTEATLRLVTVLFGVGTILLLWLLADGLGRAGTIAAGALIALSPAMVFYSRDFIHETLLAFFTLLFIGAGWRYARRRRLRWAILAGVAVGLMYATKETFVLSIGATAGAVVLTAAWKRFVQRPGPTPPGGGAKAGVNGAASGPTADGGGVALRVGAWRWWHVVAAAGSALLVAVVFFSSFFTNPQGLADAVRAFLPYLHRAAGVSAHNQPWSFYLERLLWFHHGRGPVWTEAVILVLAVVGFVSALRRRPPASVCSTLVCFLGFYALLLAAIYSAIAYKTPWCLLGFWQGAILVAGVGVAAVLGWRTKAWVQGTVSALLVLAGAHLLWQAWQGSYLHPADRKNPYAYAQTSPDILEMVEKVQALAKADPLGNDVVIKVMVPGGDYWPLPWYLRQFKQTGWWDKLPADPRAPLIIAGARLEAALEGKVEGSHTMTGIYSLRPGVFLELYVQEDLWKRFMASKERRPHP